MITVDNIGKRIYIFGRKDRIPYVKIVDDFYPYFYYENDKGKIKTIDGKRASIVKCNNPGEVRDVRRRYGYDEGKTYESDIIYSNRFIIDRLNKIEKEEPKLCYLDIEIAKTKKGFEGPQIANNPILSICCYDSFDEEYVIFHKEEKEMLQDFIDYIQEKNPDILIAWAGDLFDFPFLINRINKLGLKANNLARTGGTSYTTKYGAKIFGRILFDLMQAYKKHFSESTGRESWSLDYISRYEFKDKGGKEEYQGELDDLYKEDVEKFLSYNKRDVELLVMINEKLRITEFFDEVRRMAFCKYEDVFMNSKTADCLCLKHAKNYGFVLPSVKRNPDVSYEGGYVRSSDPKLHYNIAVLDMKSLYPSIMIGFNTSYETLDPNGKISMDDKFRFKEETGLIPSIVKPLLEQRKMTKDRMKVVKKELGKNSTEYKFLDINQYAYKVIANSFYGVLGFRYFRLYKKEVAESITYAARKIIIEVGKKFEEAGYEIIYGDTDSVFISIGERSIGDIKKLVTEINNYFKKYFSDFGIKEENNIFELEFEKIYKTIFFKRKSTGVGVKKKYAGRIIWKDGEDIDELNIVGFESRRSDSPQIGRDFLKEILRMITYEYEKEKVDEYVDVFRNKIKDGGFTGEEIGLPMGLTKHPDKYANQIHARASRLANQKHKAGIRGGDKIKYIYTKDMDGVIAFKDYMWKGYNIDYDRMVRRIVDMKIQPMYESLGWKYPYETVKISLRKKKDDFSQKTLGDYMVKLMKGGETK